jgi:hypothetical protein
MTESAMTRTFVQKNQTVLLRAVADATQAKVAEAMGGHQSSYVSRFLNCDKAGKDCQKISLDEMLAMLDVCGLALHRMGDADVIVAREEWDAMVVLAKKYMATM